MHKPLVPMLFPSFYAHISDAEFQYPDRIWKETCGIMAQLVGDSGGTIGLLMRHLNLGFPITCQYCEITLGY